MAAGLVDSVPSRATEHPLLTGARLPPHDARILAAVSGGPDSTALLIWLRESGRSVVAAHFDHALREGSDRDAEHVARICAGIGVPLHIERRAQPLPRGSLQAAARQVRYQFLERARLAAGCDLVCLGHTADDVVEGSLLHLLRGAGLAGLRGMPETRGPYHRPLLRVWRHEIEAYLAARGVEPLRDPSNADTSRFARARVRHFLLPALERGSPGFTRRLRAAAETAVRLHEQLQARAAVLLREGAIPRTDLRDQPQAIRLEAYRQLYGRQPALSRRQLQALDGLALAGATGSGLDLPGGMRFRVQPRVVSIDVATLQPPTPPTLVARPCSGCDEPDTAHLRAGLELSIGYRRPGLRLRPVGGPGTRKLQDVLTDAKVPRHLRDSLPLVFADGRLAWVPGLAVDADAAAPPGSPAVHVALSSEGGRGDAATLPLGLGWGPEFRMVLSGSQHPRSPVI